MSTQLELIEIRSAEFFPMWQSHMDSLLQHDTGVIRYTTNSVWEFVLADCRLQYVELLKLDGAVEVEFFSFDDDDVFHAVPCDELSRDITWKVNNLGWVRVPSQMDQDSHRIALSNEWWIGLRASFVPRIRSLMQYQLFAKRFLRLFIVPVRAEDYMRVIVTSNMPRVLNSLAKDSGSVGARFLTQCLIAKPAGEFPATVQDERDGTQEVHEDEVYEYLTAEQLQQQSLPVAGQCPAVHLTLQRSDSHAGHEEGEEEKTTGAGVLRTATAIAPDPPSYEAAVGIASSEKTRLALDDTPNASPSAPPLSKSNQPPAVLPTDLLLKQKDSPAASQSSKLPLDDAHNVRPSAPPLVESDQVSSKLPPPVLPADLMPKQKDSPTASQSSNAASSVPAGVISSKPVPAPLPVFIRQSSLQNQTCSLGSHLFPHQKRTVSWMLDVEAGNTEPLFVPQATMFGTWYAFTHGVEKTMFHDTVDVIVPKSGTQLARGGLLAHPVGSGKTVIAAELMRQTIPKGIHTIVFVPGHIVQQWKKELQRFVPGVNVGVIDHRTSRKSLWPSKQVHVLLIPHDLAPNVNCNGTTPFRLIVDEPQEIVSKPEIFEALLRVNSSTRWLLTATPNPLLSIMQLALGFDTQPNIPHNSMLSWFTRTRSRRDPPYFCLPVPALHIHMCPITLLWQETSVLHSYAMRDDLQSAIRLCSFFYFARGSLQQREATATLAGAKAFHSLDDWVKTHQTKLSNQLQEAKQSLQATEKKISKQKATAKRQKPPQQKQMQAGASVTAVLKSQEQYEMENEDVINLERVFEEDEPGVSLELLRVRSSCRQDVRNYERLLTFLSSISDTVTTDSECLICMNQLGGRVISMLPCLHSFCATCAAQLFIGYRHVPCPVCRQHTLRREICTFVCKEKSAVLPKNLKNLRENFGSKIFSVVQEIIRIQKEFPHDKILVFGQWHDLLRQMSDAMPEEINHVFLDGPLSRRCEIIEQFRTVPNLRVMLLSSESQSSGKSFTALLAYFDEMLHKIWFYST